MVELSGKSSERAAAFERYESVLRVPMGVVSPLWFIYAGAASAGVAYWWMSRWSKPQNLEAFFGNKRSEIEQIEADGPVVVADIAEVVVLETAAVTAEVDDDTEALEAAVFSPQAPEPAQVIEPEAAPSPEPLVDAPAPPVEAAAPVAEEPKPVAPKKARTKSASATSAKSK